MFKFIKTIIFTIGLVLTNHAVADTVNDPVNALVGQIASDYMKKNHIPGMAVELYIDGKPHEYYFGFANETKKIPVSEKTIFEVGSISKVMTSLLLAQEIDIANMGLNDSVTKYITDLPESFNKITLQDLATHTSGLAFKAPENIKNQTELSDYFAKWSPEYAPGEQWRYSNIGIGMLGYALENSTNKNFEELYRRRVLTPLGMQASGFSISGKLKSFYAQGYDQSGKPVPASAQGLFEAAYGLKMSANDMQRFLSAAIGLPGTPDRIFYPMRMTQVAYVKLADKMQGLGWQIHPLTEDNTDDLLNDSEHLLDAAKISEIYERPEFNPKSLIDKTGTTGGFRSYVAVIPSQKSGIAILTNKNDTSDAIVKLGREILFKVSKRLSS